MLFSVLITLPLILAALLTLGVGFSTAFFTARVPTGPDAMALATPVLAAGAAWILTLLAMWGCIGRGGLDWVSSRPLVPTIICTLSIVGLCVIAIGALAAWAERTSVPRILLPIAGTVVPLVLQGFLIACAWSGPESLAGAVWPRAVGIPLAAIAIGGLGVGGKLLIDAQRSSASIAAKARAEADAESAERQRRNNLSRRDRVAEDLAAIGSQDLLWKFAMMLPGESDPDARALILERINAIKDLDDQLSGTLTCQYPTLRGGAVEFVCLCQTPKPSWAPDVAKAIDLLAADIAAEGTMTSERHSVEYEAEVRRMLAVGLKFPATDFAPNIATLRAAVAGTPPSEARTRALDALK